uniref:Fibronectin type III domain containing 4b n=1 Tax=Cynoglossus semilaevis TaxID=244447 RepID=A0A3P8UD81_CYNSE
MIEYTLVLPRVLRRKLFFCSCSCHFLHLLCYIFSSSFSAFVLSSCPLTQLRAHSAMVTWNVPLGDTVIGYAISQQRQDGLMQRSIREVNSSSRWCVLWDLDENTHYSVQVQSVGPQGDSQPSHAIHFRTLERISISLSSSDEPAMEGLGMTPHLQTGELLIITTVLLLWAAVIALFCRQYDIIKDNDSNGTREKAKSSRVTHFFFFPIKLSTFIFSGASGLLFCFPLKRLFVDAVRGSPSNRSCCCHCLLHS